MNFTCFLWFLLWVPFCVCVVSIVEAQKELTICDTQGCSCNTTKTASWKNITCNLHSTQVSWCLILNPVLNVGRFLYNL